MKGRVYPALLRLYPAGHPRDEMLDVLFEAGRPMRREVVPLALGGLRARFGSDQPLAVKWLYAARAAALMLLVIQLVGTAIEIATGRPASTVLILSLTAAALAAVAVGAGWRVPAPLLAAAAFGLGAADLGDPRAVTACGLAAVLLAVPGPRTPVRSPLPPLLALAATMPSALAGWPLLLIAAAVVVWAAVDERLVLAVGLTLAVSVVQAVAYLPGNDPVLVLGLAASRLALVVVPLALGAGLALRRSRV
ncbi:hypothetical protein JIG36_16445 [Actinoplanes sp. LDG1-06]|uniref:Integral membrane protein n=1 Tax=Paractinoplanes ovalisporus TaxID=2810368 RepID=A0ABS2ABE9_9ACTN|nr:hypothetical protein [Actinoplanes ovalisporus]MBM2617144.1 hypothetical protein [Actinoplanes ovalisporus]